VAHALNREIVSLFREFELLLSQLEALLVTPTAATATTAPAGHAPLTLQKLIFLLQPSSMIFRQVAIILYLYSIYYGRYMYTI
jgi:hypothetical protein